jgi:hypothetical protein
MIATWIEEEKLELHHAHTAKVEPPRASERVLDCCTESLVRLHLESNFTCC